MPKSGSLLSHSKVHKAFSTPRFQDNLTDELEIIWSILNGQDSDRRRPTYDDTKFVALACMYLTVQQHKPSFEVDELLQCQDIRDFQAEARKLNKFLEARMLAQSSSGSNALTEV